MEAILSESQIDFWTRFADYQEWAMVEALNNNRVHLSWWNGNIAGLRGF